MFFNYKQVVKEQRCNTLEFEQIAICYLVQTCCQIVARVAILQE